MAPSIEALQDYLRTPLDAQDLPAVFGKFPTVALIDVELKVRKLQKKSNKIKNKKNKNFDVQ